MSKSNGGTEKIKQAAEFVEQARKDTVQQLVDMAHNIRQMTTGGDSSTRDKANRLARNLEQTADYLNGRAVDQIEDTTEMMRDNVWKTTLLVFVFGVIIGLLLSRD